MKYFLGFFLIFLSHSFSLGVTFSDSVSVNSESLAISDSTLIVVVDSDTTLSKLDTLLGFHLPKLDTNTAISIPVRFENEDFIWVKYSNRNHFYSKSIQYTDTTNSEIKKGKYCWISKKEEFSFQWKGNRLISKGMACFLATDSTWEIQNYSGDLKWWPNNNSNGVFISEGKGLLAENAVPQLMEITKPGFVEKFEFLTMFPWEEKVVTRRNLVEDLYSGRFLAAVILYALFAVGMGVINE